VGDVERDSAVRGSYGGTQEEDGGESGAVGAQKKNILDTKQISYGKVILGYGVGMQGSEICMRGAKWIGPLASQWTMADEIFNKVGKTQSVHLCIEARDW